MSFEYSFSKTKPHFLMASNILKNNQPKQLFIGFADMLNSSAVKPLLSPAEISSLGFRKYTTVDMFPERQKPEEL